MTCADRVEKLIQDRRLFAIGQRIVVAVSGGLDSMLLLHLLSKWAPQYQWQLVIAHFNHQYRAAESEADEVLVRRTAAKLGWNCIVEKGCPKKISRMSREMTARRLRHKFFARVAKENVVSTIALAHHADDQLELFFLRLFRGTGTRGAGGMRLIQPGSAGYGLVVRPFLYERKSALEAEARRHSIDFHDDSSNVDRAYYRNRIRHDLLPYLREQWGPAIERNVLRSMEILAGAADCIELAAQKWLEKGGPDSFPDLPMALQRQCLCLQLDRLGIVASFDLVESLRCSPERRVVSAQARRIYRDAQGIIHAERQAPLQFNRSVASLQIDAPHGHCQFGDLEIHWTIETPKGPVNFAPEKGVESFDARKVGRAVTLRHWQPGDRFQPLGFQTPAKLQDLLINRKIPRTTRHQLVVAATQRGELFWVEGLPPSEKFKLDSGTDLLLDWQWHRPF